MIASRERVAAMISVAVCGMLFDISKLGMLGYEMMGVVGNGVVDDG